jgi:hypothetical protein
LLELIEVGIGWWLRRGVFAGLLTAQVEGGEHAVHGVFDCGSHGDVMIGRDGLKDGPREKERRVSTIGKVKYHQNRRASCPTTSKHWSYRHATSIYRHM